MNYVLESRSMSGFPVSIATGLALETLFEPKIEVVDVEREHPFIKDLNYYNVYMFNIDTLIRNIQGSISAKDVYELKPREVYECLSDEIKMLRLLFAEHNLNVQFYVNSYRYYHDKYADRMFIPRTTKQKLKYAHHEFAHKALEKEPSVLKFRHKLSFSKGMRCLLVSHIPADLLSAGNFRTLDLLESHTGKIKTYSEYNTKYKPIDGKDMSFLPFFEYLLLMFGDETMFKSQPIEKVLETYRSLEKLGVNPSTTELGLSGRLL